MGKAVGGIAVAVIGALIVFFLVGDKGIFNHKDPASLGGDIRSVELANGTPCCTFAVQAEVDGMDGKECRLWAQIISTSGAKGRAFNVGSFSAEADKDVAIGNFSVPITRAGSFHVHFTLVDPKGTELDSGDSGEVQVG